MDKCLECLYETEAVTAGISVGKWVLFGLIALIFYSYKTNKK